MLRTVISHCSTLKCVRVSGYIAPEHLRALLFQLFFIINTMYMDLSFSSNEACSVMVRET